MLMLANLLHIVAIGQPEVLLWSDVAQQGGTCIGLWDREVSGSEAAWQWGAWTDMQGC